MPNDSTTPATITTLPDGALAITVGAWSLRAETAEDEPRVRDIDLAERLGYERPRKIRDLIERLIREKKLNDFIVRPAAGQTIGRPASEYWLTEAQAIKVVSKSETAKADAILDEVIAVYMAVRRGMYQPAPVVQGQGITIEVLAAALAPFAKGFEALSLGFAAMSDRLTVLEQRSRDGEIMSRERSNALKARVRSCALDLSKYGNEKRRAASLRMHKRLKMKVGWFGDHCRLDNMPARYEADVLREMEIIEHETRGSVTASRQMSFPPLRAVNVNGKRTSA